MLYVLLQHYYRQYAVCTTTDGMLYVLLQTVCCMYYYRLYVLYVLLQTVCCMYYYSKKINNYSSSIQEETAKNITTLAFHSSSLSTPHKEQLVAFPCSVDTKVEINMMELRIQNANI